MPSRRRTLASNSIFEDHTVLAQETDVDGLWDKCSLTLRFNQTQSQGIISIRHVAEYEGTDTQLITLRIPFESLEQVTIVDPKEIPHAIKDHLSRDSSIQSYDQVLILSLNMHTAGSVVVPPTVTTNLTPKDTSRTQVQALQALCRATMLLLYIPSLDMTEPRRIALQNLSAIANTGKLCSLPLDLRRMHGGRGGRQTNWEVFNIPEPAPPYVQHLDAPTIGKRAREDSPGTRATSPLSKRPANGSGAFSSGAHAHLSGGDPKAGLPANINSAPRRTSLSRPNASSIITNLSDQDVIGDAVREMLRGAARAELGAMLPTMLRDVVREELPSVLQGRLPEAIQHTLRTTINPAYLRRALRPLVLTHLPDLVSTYIDEEGPLDDMLSAAELHFEEAVSDAVTDVKQAGEECLKEIREAETTALERLAAVDWDDDLGVVRGLTEEREREARKEEGRREIEKIQVRAEEKEEDWRLNVHNGQRVFQWKRSRRFSSTTTTDTNAESQSRRSYIETHNPNEQKDSSPYTPQRLSQSMSAPTASESQNTEEGANANTCHYDRRIEDAQRVPALDRIFEAVASSSIEQDTMDSQSSLRRVEKFEGLDGGETETRSNGSQPDGGDWAMWFGGEAASMTPTEPNTEAETGSVRVAGIGRLAEAVSVGEEKARGGVGGFMIRSDCKMGWVERIVRKRREVSV